jgi:hypothetical protein
MLICIQCAIAMAFYKVVQTAATQKQLRGRSVVVLKYETLNYQTHLAPKQVERV